MVLVGCFLYLWSMNTTLTALSFDRLHHDVLSSPVWFATKAHARIQAMAHQRNLIRTHSTIHRAIIPKPSTVPSGLYKMKHISKRNQNAMLGTYYGAFRTHPSIPQSLNHSWAAPLVAPTRRDPVTEPSKYRFASRAPVVRRRSPSSKHPTPKTAQQAPFSNGKPNVPSCAYRPHTRSAPARAPEQPRHGDLDIQYDEFLASFQHRIDGMTGQRGGWGF